MKKVLFSLLVISLLFSSGVALAKNDNSKSTEKIIDLLINGAGKSGKVPPGLEHAPGIEKKLGSLDFTAPIISEINVSVISENSATVTWITDENSTSVVDYGTSSTLYIYSETGTTTASSTNYVHTLDLSALLADTVYYFIVKSEDGNNNLAISGEQSFTTLPPPPVCGNGTVEDGEECDDGNIDNGDGCDESCQIEETPNPISECSASTICGEFCNHGSLTYGTIVGDDGKCWLDRNLGATQVATASNDSASYGWLFQWGRGADGHQIRTSQVTSTPSSTDVPGHDFFIHGIGYNADWRDPRNDNLWQGVNGINNPCPTGFRLPTQQEWTTLLISADITDSVTAFDSVLKLPLGGYRGHVGNYEDEYLFSYYWSSTVDEGRTLSLLIGSPEASGTYNDTVSAPRAAGFSVRCLADATLQESYLSNPFSSSLEFIATTAIPSVADKSNIHLVDFTLQDFAPSPYEGTIYTHGPYEEIQVRRIKFTVDSSIPLSSLSDLRLINLDTDYIMPAVFNIETNTIEVSVVINVSEPDFGVMVSWHSYGLVAAVDSAVSGAIRFFVANDSDVDAFDYRNDIRVATITALNTFPLYGPQLTF